MKNKKAKKKLNSTEAVLLAVRTLDNAGGHVGGKRAMRQQAKQANNTQKTKKGLPLFQWCAIWLDFQCQTPRYRPRSVFTCPLPDPTDAQLAVGARGAILPVRAIFRLSPRVYQLCISGGPVKSMPPCSSPQPQLRTGPVRFEPGIPGMCAHRGSEIRRLAPSARDRAGRCQVSGAVSGLILRAAINFAYC